MRTSIILLIFAFLGILFVSLLVSAGPPDSYCIVYVNTDDKQQIASEERCYILNNTKMRIELIEDGKVSEIGLYHKERKSLYTLYPSSKLYSLHRMRDEDWNWGQKKVDFKNLGKKKGRTECLGYVCDTYEKKAANRITKTTVSRDYKVVFKIVTEEKGKIITQTEAKEFKLVKPDASIFEIPDGYVDAMSI